MYGTVTYIPDGKGNFVFTSSRDESPLNTIPPALYEEKGVALLYPKDTVAGGSRILLSEKKTFGVSYEWYGYTFEKYLSKSRGVL